MAIKISGSTIINDDRVIVNADKIGIGTTNPQVALEIFSGDVGIGTTNPTASNIEIALNNNTNVLAVGIVTADNIFGTFKGTIDEGTGIDRANRVKIISNADNAVKYLSFVDNTGANGFGTIFYNTNITYNPNSDGSNNGELNIDGNVKIDGRLSAKDFLNVESVGFVTAGTGLKVTQGGLIVTGPSTFSGNLIPGANDTYDIGKDPSVAGNYRWNKVYAKEYYGTFKGTVDPSVAADRIQEGNTSAEVVDTGTDGHFKVVTENAERLRVNESGHVGIGTDLSGSGTHKLHVFNGTGCGSQSSGIGEVVIESSNAATIQLLSPSGNINPQTIYFGDESSGSSGRLQYSHSSDSMIFKTNGNNERLRIHASGDATFTGSVGIGTTNPDAPVLSSNNNKLAVGIVTAREYYGTFKGTIDPAVADDRIEQGDTKAQVVDTNGNGHFLVETEGQERFRIIEDGKVGIGTTEPRELLNVGFGTARFEGRGDLIFKGNQLIGGRNPAIRLGSANNAANAEVDLLFHADNGEHPRIASRRLIGDGDAARIQFTSSGTYARKAITFWTKSAGSYSADPLERMRITRDGNIGIGTTLPNSDSEVADNQKILAVAGIVTAKEFYGNTFYGNLVGGISNTGDVTITGNLAVEGNTTLGDAVGDILTVNATPTFKEDATFNKSVSIGGTLTYEDVTNVDSIGLITARTGLRVTQGGIQVNTGITTLMDNVGIGTKNPNDPVTSSNTAKLAVGIVTAHEFRGGTFYGTIDSTVNTISLNTNLQDVFSVSGNQLSAKDVNADKIIFWDDSPGELTHLNIGTGLSITGTEITATKDAGKTYTLPLIGTNGGSGVGIVTWTLTDDDSPVTTDSVTLKAGSNITISSVDEINHEFKIEAVQGAGVGIAASASQVLNVHSGNIGGVNPGLSSDRIVYWDEDGIADGRLDYLDIGSGLEIINNQLKVDSSVVGKSYDLLSTVENGTSGNGGNSGIATIILRENSDSSTDDPVKIQAGSGIVIDSVTDGFKISADISNGGGGGISTVNVIQYSDNADPRTVRSAVNPIDVQETVGIVTIGIGTTSNAYGSRFLGPDTPSGAVEGDIWYDTSTTGQGISRVAVVKDQKNYNVDGGTFGRNGWRDRDLTVEDDPFGLVIFYPTVRSDGADPQTQPSETGVSSPPSGAKPGYFSLSAGKYKIRFKAPAFKVNQHMARMVWSSNQSTINKIVDISTDSFDGQANGSSEFGNDNYGRVTNGSEGAFIVQITQTSYFKVIHYSKASQSSNGFGESVSITSSDPETYTIVEIEDLAAAIKDDSNTNRIIQGNTKAEVNDTNGDGHFLVETEGSERLRITQGGNVGIGTIDPYYRLHAFFNDSATSLSGGGNGNWGGNGIRIENDNNTIGAMSLVQFRVDNADWHIGNKRTTGSDPVGNSDFVFNEEGSEKLRITSIGDVGIGTTNPTAVVGVGNTAVLAVGIVTAHEAYINALNLNTSGAGVGDLLTSGGPDGIFGIYNTTNSGKTIFPVKDSSGNYNDILELLNDRAIIDGNVGIGSTIPKTKLDVHGTDAIVVPVGTTAERPSNASAGMFRYNSTEEQFEGYTNSWGAIAGSGSGGGNVATSIQTFTTAGSFTYTPTPGTTSIIVHCIGAGGASGTPATSAWTGGGGGGGVAIKTYNLVQLGSNASVVVPAASGYDTFPNLNNGPNGGNASFSPSGTGPTIIGYGGTGSSAASGATGYSEGGDGGIGSGGDINLTGDKGYVVRDQYQPTSTLVAELRTNAGSPVSSYHINRAKAAGGGYGQYGLGGEATFTSANSYNNGRGGTAGAVIIYEFAGSGSGGSGIGSSFVLLPEQTVTAGDTYVEFTDIPSDALEITLLFKGLSASGGNHFVVQLGTSSGYITSGYVGNSENSMGTAAVASNTTDKPGFVIYGDGGGAEFHGSMIINKASSNSYTEIGEFRKSNTGGAVSRGSLSSVSGTVDRLKIFLNGTNTFDAGTMSLSYKTSGSGSTAAITKVAVLQDVRGQGTNGGIALTNNWHGRRLNTKLDPTNFVAFTSTAVDSNGDGENNTFILGAGTYLLQWRAPGFDAGKMIAKMAYTTDPNYNTLFNSQNSAGVNYLSGETAQTSSGISATSSTASGDLYATGSATVTINQTTYFRLQHYVSHVATVAAQTLGRNNDINGENEIYSQVIVQDLETSSLSGGAHVNVGATPPTSPSPKPGDLWWNSDNGDLHVYYTTQWVAVNSDERIQKVSATGGTTNIVNGYKVHKFTTSGTFDVTASGEVEVLVVAGGGSEGGSTTSPGQPGCHGGGGGGGGGVVRKLIDVHAGSKYKVTVGAGGGWRSNGGNSSFAGEAQALGGGAGGATLTANGNGGGSGGGASRATLTNQGGASEQVNTYGYGMGNNGGNIGNPDTTPGGGGGAGGAGSSGSPQGNGDGGPGYDASDFEVGLYVGAGGNANGSANSSAEGRTPNNTNGAANTGAGGGGSPGGTNPRYSGGSGVVFVRYVI